MRLNIDKSGDIKQLIELSYKSGDIKQLNKLVPKKRKKHKQILSMQDNLKIEADIQIYLDLERINLLKLEETEN